MYSQIIKLLKKSLPTVKTLTGMEWQNVKVKKELQYTGILGGS